MNDNRVAEQPLALPGSANNTVLNLYRFFSLVFSRFSPSNYFHWNSGEAKITLNWTYTLISDGSSLPQKSINPQNSKLCFVCHFLVCIFFGIFVYFIVKLWWKIKSKLKAQIKMIYKSYRLSGLCEANQYNK